MVNKVLTVSFLVIAVIAWLFITGVYILLLPVAIVAAIIILAVKVLLGIGKDRR